MAIAREEDEDVQMILTVITRKVSGAFQVLYRVVDSEMSFAVPFSLLTIREDDQIICPVTPLAKEVSPPMNFIPLPKNLIPPVFGVPHSALIRQTPQNLQDSRYILTRFPAWHVRPFPNLDPEQQGWSPGAVVRACESMQKERKHKIAGDKCWADDVLGMASARSTGEKSNARSVTRFLSTPTNPRSVWNQNKRTLQNLTKAALFVTLGSSIGACTAPTTQSGRSFSSSNTPICYLLEKMPRGMPRGHDTTSFHDSWKRGSAPELFARMERRAADGS
ncbi:hypothetical protein BU15DRAFT_67752 [Melanogaster broomeanus]|nr:hypothetical protein BU15DRAFT_67752 [Melanogaster broomeanus]